MIKLFTTPSCLGCKNAKKFFEENNVEIIEKDFTKVKLEPQEVKDILSLTEYGMDDLIATKSAAYKKIKASIEDMPLNDVIDFIIDHPEVIHRPIIIQYVNNLPLRLLIGYNNSDITIFLSTDYQKFHKYVPCNFGACLSEHNRKEFKNEVD
ncbi:MAG: Spx/MgsR family RNA polymerase-binding regulatory protein [Mycoplasmataceae bacterium]|jgi:regulatory protein spx|nr:Spx/MgsR family RNA polymerase-binding regulatory protein [Mycoplasmataceae bacterium]